MATLDRSRLRNILVVVAAGLVLSACSNNWGWYVISPETAQGQRNLRFLMLGFEMTVLLSVIAMAFATVIGFGIALMGLYGNRPVRAVNRVYVELFRAIPVLMMILWVH